jgi:hypothetical protein
MLDCVCRVSRKVTLTVGSSALAGLPTSVQIQRSRKWAQMLRRMQPTLSPRTREGGSDADRDDGR